MEYTVYEPEKYVKMGIKVWPMMFRELFASGELIWRLFIRDWSARYRQSLLGYLWAVVPPVVAVATFVLLGKKGVVNISVKDVPYQIYALAGLAVWQLFATGVISGCGSLVNSGGMVNKINISLEALVLSSVAQAIPEFLIKCLLIAAAFPVFRFTPPLACLLFPLAVIPIYVLTAGLSLVLSLVNGVMRDTVNVVTLVTMFLMLLTPVLYPLNPASSIVFRFNPLYYLVQGPRDLVIYGRITDPVGFAAASLFSMGVFLLCFRAFYIAKTKVPERM